MSPFTLSRRLLAVVLAWFFFHAPSALVAAPLERAAVMAPLLLQDGDWDHFKAQLVQAKSIGVDAVTSDVWWGAVENAHDQGFDWSYYDRLSDTIIEAGLQWVPILSFHACGTNVGDNVKVPLPEWLWSHFPLEADALRYRSEQGNVTSEVLSLWANPTVKYQYQEFMEAFRNHFASKVGSIAEINLSCGSAGELRYPSYNAHDSGAGYPARGALQCYSAPALAAFRGAMLQKYGALDRLNEAWGTALTDPEEIRPPSDAPGFFERGDYVRTAYGRDFIAWYHQSLLDHGKLMIELGRDTFTGPFDGIPLGIKVPGVHWRMGDPRHPRVAEMCAGLIPSHIDYQSDSTAHGYASVLELLAGFNTESRRVVLHFTCLEMGNALLPPAYSQAENLVFWVATGAQQRGLPIMGENALDGGVTNDFGWGRIDNAFRYAGYTGLTVLRIGEVTDHTVGRDHYRSFIQTYKQPVQHLLP